MTVMTLGELIDTLTNMKEKTSEDTEIILRESTDFLSKKFLWEINFIQSSCAINNFVDREYIEFGFQEKEVDELIDVRD